MVEKKAKTTKPAAKASKAKKSPATKKAVPAKTGAKVVSGHATLRDVRISAQKARLAVNLIRGKQVEQALQLLRFTPKKSTALVEKLLMSAIANARERNGADADRLWVCGGWVDGGKVLKRYMPRARGMATQILKRSAHITIEVGEK
jgi:large subunit ribosomal protein L22